MQWWSWAGKNSDSCVPSETRPTGGKQEAMGKGWGGGTGLHRETYKILNFPTTGRERKAASPSTRHPHRLPQPPVHRARHPSGSPGEAAGGGRRGSSSPGASASSPSSPPDPTQPRAGGSSAKRQASSLPHTQVYGRTHIYTDAHTQANARGFFMKAGRWTSGGEICELPSEHPLQLTSHRTEPPDTRPQPDAALTYLHAARKSSHR